MTASAEVSRRVRWTRRALILAAITLTVLTTSIPAEARTATARANTIVRMLRFVEWEAATRGEALTVAVVDNVALAAALREACAETQPGGRTVTVVDVASPRALAALNAAVVVLGPQSAGAARLLSDQGVLTVGAGDCPDDAGLMLNLIADGDQYRFSANPSVAARGRVHLSSRLLRLARIVTE